jgi:hypothetical protein
MDYKKPTPLFDKSIPRRVCPICGERSYSRQGIHPQCAVKQADAPRQTQLAEEKRQARLMAEAQRTV